LKTRYGVVELNLSADAVKSKQFGNMDAGTVKVRLVRLNSDFGNVEWLAVERSVGALAVSVRLPTSLTANPDVTRA